MSSTRIAGHATREGTERYFAARGLPPSAAKAFGHSDAEFVATTGFGCYRVHVDVPGHADAMRSALRRGINLIDTSSNYTDGGSERLVGRVLAELINAKEIARDEIVVVSKVGYIQAGNMDLAIRREAEGRPFPEIVKYADGCWHCLHPDFLADQLERSLDRLGLETIDYYLLHNPEYFLMDAKNRGLLDDDAGIEATHKTYYERIRRAFDYLDTQVHAGRIGGYGVSSNTLTAEHDDPTLTSLDQLQAAAPSQGFRCVQFPLNLYEAGGALEFNCDDLNASVLERAAELGLGTLANRPINASSVHGMTRLASFPQTSEEQLEATVAEHRQGLESLADVWDAQVRRALDDAGLADAAADMAQAIQLMNGLSRSYGQFANAMHWDYIRSQRVEPQVATPLHALDQPARDLEVWRQWSADFRRHALGMLTAIDAYYHNQAAAEADRIAAALDRLEPMLIPTPTLQQKCLQLYHSLDGMSCVLLGMRELAYVDDAIAAATLPLTSDRSARATLATFHAPAQH